MTLQEARSQHCGRSGKALLPSCMLTQESIICSLRLRGHIPALPLHVSLSAHPSVHPCTICSFNKHVCNDCGQGLRTPSGQARLSHQAEREAPSQALCAAQLWGLGVPPGWATWLIDPRVAWGLSPWKGQPQRRPGHRPRCPLFPPPPCGSGTRRGAMGLLPPAGHG